MSILKRCTRCVLPETHETILFDNDGVCNICRQHEHKKENIDWKDRKKDLMRLLKTIVVNTIMIVLSPLAEAKIQHRPCIILLRNMALNRWLCGLIMGFCGRKY